MYFLLSLCLFSNFFIFSAEIERKKDPLWMVELRGYLVNKTKKEKDQKEISKSCEYYISQSRYQSEVPRQLVTDDNQTIKGLAFGNTIRVAILANSKNTLRFWDMRSKNIQGSYIFEEGEKIESITVTQDGSLIGACINACKRSGNPCLLLRDIQYFYAFSIVGNTLKKLYELAINEKGFGSKGQVKPFIHNTKLIVAYSLSNPIEFDPYPLLDLSVITPEQDSFLDSFYQQYEKETAEKGIFCKTFRERSEEYAIYRSLPSVVKKWLQAIAYISTI